MRKFIFLFLSALLFSQLSLSDELSLGSVLRTYPLSFAADAQGKKDFLIWDQRAESGKKWMYGLVQPTMTVGSQGLIEGGLRFFPISFFELAYSYSQTHRFYYKVKPFEECNTEICNGHVNRSKLTARLAVEHNNWLAVLSANHIVSQHNDNSLPLADEAENLLSRNGGDTFETQSILVGKTEDFLFYGIYAKQGEFKYSKNKNESQYFLMRLKFEAESYGLGLGRYASDTMNPEFSMFASVAWRWGKTEALF